MSTTAAHSAKAQNERIPKRRQQACVRGTTTTIITYTARNQVGVNAASEPIRMVSSSTPKRFAVAAMTAQTVTSGTTGPMRRRSRALSHTP